MLIFVLFAGKLVPFLENTAAQTSVLTICAISIERYYAICRPLKVRIIFTHTGTAKILCAFWVLSSCFTLPLTIITKYRSATFHDGTPVYVCRTQILLTWEQMYVFTLAFLFFIFPLAIIVVLYTLIGKKLLKQRADIKMSSGNTRGMLSLKLRKQIVLMLGTVTALFFVCLLPFKVLSLWHIYATEEHLEYLGLETYLNLTSFARTMYYLNSAINPIVYNLVSTRFRNYFKRSVTCQRHTNENVTLGQPVLFTSNFQKTKPSSSASMYDDPADITVNQLHQNCAMIKMVKSVNDKLGLPEHSI